ncbi:MULTISPECIES: potassium-transporting ATPase subunit KdpA [unclassified Agrococcus]|uniref:potassium-transporting ATPase subunit KdpA n=1 Tax=unclassified Agrococcus TaxID=2615065 RepID=UPI00361C7501
MDATASAWLTGGASLAVVLVVLALVHRPLGDHLARTYTSTRDLRIERGLYRLMGVDPRAEQTWQAYARAVLAFSLVGVLALYLLQRLQPVLPYALGLPAVPELLSFNTAASFVGNTNWQSYVPEATVGYAVQSAGLVVQNFVSAAIGMAVAVALVRGLVARGAGTIGNVWVDLTRGTIRVLLPISLLGALVLLAAGVVQDLAGFQQVQTLAGLPQLLPGGPVASQESIRLLGTNGGGFFNANAAHPLENPAGWTSLLQILLMLAIPSAMPRMLGTMVGDRRQGLAIVAIMLVLLLALWAAAMAFETAAGGTATQLAGAAMEGKEVRFGVDGSVLFGIVSTGTSTGAVNSMHDSWTALGGMMPLLAMMLGEVAPGGVGAGLYGILVLSIIAVFVAGLLVGRTPEYLGKRITAREMQLAALSILVTPTLVLGGTALSFAIPAVRADVESTSIWNPGVHGLTEVLYAFTSAANNNGSAFAGLTANTDWLNAALGVVILLGRFLPIILVLALAGSFARQDRVPSTAGTLPTHTPLFVGLTTGVIVLVSALTYLPVLALGPLAEGLVA